MGQRIANPRERLLYEIAERKAKELQANSKSEAIKAIKIQSYDEYVESMDSSGLPKTGTQYWHGSPQPTSADLGGNSSTKLESGRKYASRQWKKMVHASGKAEPLGSAFYHSSGIDPDSKPDSPQAIGFLSQEEFEDLQSKGVSLGKVEKFTNFQEGANFFQNNIGDFFHGTGIAGGHPGDVPHFLGQGSAANQGALYLSPSSVFAGGYASSTVSWNQGTGGHLYKGSIDFNQHNIFNPANSAHIEMLREYLINQDYTDEEFEAITKNSFSAKRLGGITLPQSHPAFSTLTKAERISRLKAPVDSVIRSIEHFDWRALQVGGYTIAIPNGQLGAGQHRDAMRVNDSIRNLGFTGWVEEEGGHTNLALFDTAKAGEKTNIPNFKFTEKRLISPEVVLDSRFSTVTGQENFLDSKREQPNPEHLRRIIPGETRGQGTGIERISQYIGNYEDLILDTRWHGTGSASAYDIIGQEYYFQQGENFQWQRGLLSISDRDAQVDFKNPEFTRFADDLVKDMQRLSETPKNGGNITTPTPDPELDSKVGSAIDPSDAGTPGQPQPPPGTAAVIDEVASKNLAKPNGSLPSSGAKEIGNNPAGDEKLKVPSSEETPKISDTSRLISSEEEKIPRPETASAAKINTEEERVNAQEQSKKATNAAADAENQAGAKVSGAESEAKTSSGEKASSTEKGSAKADAGPAGPKAGEVVEEITEKQKEKYKNQILKAQAIINDPAASEGEKNAAKNLVNKLNEKLGRSAGNPSTATSGGGPSKPSTAGVGTGGGGRPPNRPSGGVNTPGNASSSGVGSSGGGSPGGGGAGGPGGPGGNGRPPGRPPSGASPGGGSPGGGAGGGGGPGGPHWNRGASGVGHGAHAAAGGAGGAKAAAAAAAGQPLNIRGGIKNAYGNIRSAFSSFFSSGGGARGPRGGFGTVAGAAATASRPGTRTSSIIKAWAFNSSLLEREMDLTTRGFIAGLGSIVNDLGLNRRETAYGTNGKASAYMDTFFGTTIRGGKGFAHPSMEVTSSGTRTGRVVWSTKATAQEALEGWSTHIDDAVTHSSGVMRGMNRIRQFTFNLLGGKTSTINRTIARLGGAGTLVAPTFLGITAVSDFRQGYRHGGIPGGLVGAAKGVATGWIVNKIMASALLNPVAAVITGAALGATAYTGYKIFDVRNQGSNYLKMGRMQGMSWNKGPTAGMNSLMANTIKHRSIMGMENSRLNAMRSMGNEGYMMSAPKSRYANSTAIHSNSSLLSLANS